MIIAILIYISTSHNTYIDNEFNYTFNEYNTSKHKGILGVHINLMTPMTSNILIITWLVSSK